jgi:hypothetical protein
LNLFVLFDFRQLRPLRATCRANDHVIIETDDVSIINTSKSGLRRILKLLRKGWGWMQKGLEVSRSQDNAKNVSWAASSHPGAALHSGEALHCDVALHCGAALHPGLVKIGDRPNYRFKLF